MEDALKARLIGASILVLLAVVLLPELLSGPKPLPGAAGGTAGKGTRTITIDLGGAVAAGSQATPRPDTAPAPATTATTLPTVQAPAATTAALDETSEPLGEPAAEPPATATEPAAKVPAVTTVPKPAPVTTAVATKPAPVPAPTPKASAGGFAVQVGAFGSATGARKLVTDLQAAGFPAYLLQPAPGKKLHRVRVGPVPDRAAADKLAAKLKSRGLPANVVTDG
jgi:cell division septation protein DedD